MNFVSKCPINKGWSSDKKYCVTDKNGTRYLLRVSDIAEYDKKQLEFNMMKQVAALDVPMCQPIEFGVKALFEASSIGQIAPSPDWTFEPADYINPDCKRTYYPSSGYQKIQGKS